MKNKFLLIIIFLVYSATSLAQVDSTYQGQLSDLVIEENPDFFVNYLSTVNLNKENFLVSYFVFKAKNGDWLGGSGFEIVKSNREKLLWYKKIDGDFGPHSVQMIDLNKDGTLDLFFYAGFEDVFSTYIYLGNYEEEFSYSESNFTKIYANENDYSVLIDFDNDQKPEVLDSGYEGNEHKNGFSCFDNPSDIAVKEENRLVISDSIQTAITKKYTEVTGSFDQYNFDYSMPEVYPLFNTFILAPIKIYKIEGDKLLNVTSEYPKYLNWRINILRQIKRDSSEKCVDNIHKVIAYLKKKIDE